MCVEATRSALFSRASFLAAAGAAAAPILAKGASVAAPLLVPQHLSPANKRAATIASESPFIRAKFAALLEVVNGIGDAHLRADALALIRDPAPRYARKYATPESRVELRDALAREGLVKADAPVSGIFPPGTETGKLVQPFWSAPGSDLQSHHSYPGGLLVHELFNSTMAANFSRTYDAVYFDNAARVNRDVTVAAALYHDIMKTVVFQFNDDGTLLPELSIGDTGGHHALSGAEAIVRGHDARFVTVLLSAHAAPSLGDEQKVVTWCRAAAIIAGVDPIDFGLVKKQAGSYALAQVPPAEAFVNYLSDHDFVLTIPAVRAIAPLLQRINPSLWYRHEVLSKYSAVALYQTLAMGGDPL
jgi:hypothetical protein